MTAPLTPAMRVVLEQMARGWGLYVTGAGAFDGGPRRVRLQQNGRGSGGITARVHGSTFDALVSRGLVVHVGSRDYTLTAAGRSAVAS